MKARPPRSGLPAAHPIQTRRLVRCLWCAALLWSAGAQEVIAMGPVRQPAVAGQFYADDGAALRREILAHLQAAESRPPSGPLAALLAPHAGYMYSGPVAGWAYRQVMGRSFETVVVLAPSHRVPFRGVSVFPSGAYRTPLGDVAVDQDRCQALIQASPSVREFPDAHGPEHALEVQLPFLQVALEEGWRLVPLVMGSQDLETARAVAEALRKVLEDTPALVVASSDLSHFHPSSRAEALDRKALQYLERVDPEGLWAEARGGRVEACGLGPILVAMLMAQRAGIREGTLLRYAHSGDVSGDHSRVVGYAAMLWAKASGAPAAEREKVGVDLGLNEQEKRLLKEIARTAIHCGLEGKPLPQFRELTPTLREPRGAFVTLEKRRRLRGCIGFIQAVKPLHLTIQEMATAAAFRDPRFPPLSEEEWPEVEIEISVLTPMRRISEASEIRVGTHGLYVVREPHRGLLLPQVATDHGWDREAFLEHTCTKAGLPTDAWKDPETQIHVFSADIF